MPNILYIHSHDTGRFVQPYGHPVPTPRIAALADQGVLFRNAFSAAPTCSPSRAALVTGQWPHETGMLGLAHRGFSLRDYSTHLAHLLRPHGFECLLSGVQHIDNRVDRPGSHGRRIGYDRILDSDDRTGPGSSSAPERRAVEFLRDRPTRPFFLSVGFQQTHRPFPDPDPTDDPERCLPPPGIPDLPATRRDMAGFRASARELDRRIGDVLDALDDARLADDTLVICTTDHGIAFPRMKCNLTDGGIGVMLICRGPGGFSGGRIVDAMVSQVDVVPTLCDWLGINAPERLRGVSMLPVVHGETDRVRGETFAEVTFHAAYEPQRCCRTSRWKYIRRFDDRDRPVLPNCDDGPSKTAWMEAGWSERSPGAEALYDLAFDPLETCDLSRDPLRGDQLAEMRARLDRWMRATDDPLLDGPVPAPPGAVVTDPDAVSP